MIIDTSALVAIIRDEPDAKTYAQAIEGAGSRRLSAAGYLECGVVTDAGRDPVLSRKLDELIRVSAIVVEPVTATQAMLARDAYRDFGKGSGHKAGLNFGDCFSYALAKAYSEPLLFGGNDFTHTDLTSALEIRDPQ